MIISLGIYSLFFDILRLRHQSRGSNYYKVVTSRMFLKNLSLINYKNFESQNFEFDAKINCFVGANGIGKTNILDAIYHLSLGKSYFNPIATQNIKHGSDFFVIDGTFTKDDRDEKIVCSLKRGAKKIIKRNHKKFK